MYVSKRKCLFSVVEFILFITPRPIFKVNKVTDNKKQYIFTWLHSVNN